MSDRNDDGIKNQVKGKGKEIEGRVRDGVADITGDNSEQFKGKAKRIEGEAQQELGKAQRDSTTDR